MNANMREHATKLMNGFLVIKNPSADGESFVSGYLAATRDAGGITPAEYEVALAVVRGRDIPPGLPSSPWWGMAV